jgi:hypothetical protein
MAMVEKWSDEESLKDEFYFLPEEDEVVESTEHFRWVDDEIRRYLAAAEKKNITVESEGGLRRRRKAEN